MEKVVEPGQTVSATRFAQLTGVARERLRTWERRFGFPEPMRQPGGGRRRYRLADVAAVVAVRRAAAEGVPLPVAIERASLRATASAPMTFRGLFEHAPVPVALVSGPAPLRLEYANVALRALDGAPRAGEELAALGASPAGELLREHFARDLEAVQIEHTMWGVPGGHGPARSVLYGVPSGPGERPLVAIVGLESGDEHALRRLLADRDDELATLRRRDERHDRWLDAIAAVSEQFQHEPGPAVMDSALDVLIRKTVAVDAGLAPYVSGRLALRGSRRGVLATATLTVAAHPELGRALRDAEGLWMDRTLAGLLGVPDDLHAAGMPVAVAGEVLGLLILVFDELEPYDADNRRLLAAISAALGFAMLRDRLSRELRATVSPGLDPPGRRAADGRSTDG